MAVAMRNPRHIRRLQGGVSEMQNRDTTTLVTDAQRPFALGRNESFSSGVSWGAILGGAFVAAAMGLILVSLGTGLGFASAPGG